MKSPDPGSDRYQLLPPLTDDEFASLKADIALHGVLVPVVIDADSGEVVEGHHRVRAWTEASIREGRGVGLSARGSPLRG